MMNVKLYSDLHLEFDKENAQFHPGEGDVLILAGDICTAKDIKKDNPHGRIYRTFFDTCVKNYNKVLYIMGNHEHYGHNFTYTAKKLRENLPKGVNLLDNEVITYNGWNFMGATLWTDFAGQNPIAMQLAQSMMNDYHTIRYGEGYRKLTPNDILREYNHTLYWMEETLNELDGPVFMITHHQPSYESIQSKYRGNANNCCYASELSRFIVERPQIKHWVAGHTHESFTYMIDSCQVSCNPRGYSGHGLNSDFNPNFTLTLS